MNAANEKYLFDNFDFLDRDQMRTFGSENIDCGNGWFKLIKELCEKITDLGLNNLKVVRVKEKLGGLRFYYDCPGITEDEQNVLIDLISHAEQKSYEACETCGEPAQLRKVGWLILTMCDNCIIFEIVP